eukprot:292574-Hanusia_phi.AAC.7
MSGIQEIEPVRGVIGARCRRQGEAEVIGCLDNLRNRRGPADPSELSPSDQCRRAPGSPSLRTVTPMPSSGPVPVAAVKSRRPGGGESDAVPLLGHPDRP